MNGHRLYRSPGDRVILGVCGGLAEYFDADPTAVRLLWFIVTVFTGIVPFLIIYLLMGVVVPEGTNDPYGWSAGPWQSPGTGAGTWQSPGTTPGQVPGDPGTAPAGTPPDAGFGTPPSDASSGPGFVAPPGPDAGPAGAPGGPQGWNPAPPPGDWRSQRAYARAQRRAERAYWRSQRRGDPGTGALIFGGLLILIGAAFFVRNVYPGFDFDIVWPVVIILFGAVILVGAFRR